MADTISPLRAAMSRLGIVSDIKNGVRFLPSGEIAHGNGSLSANNPLRGTTEKKPNHGVRDHRSEKPSSTATVGRSHAGGGIITPEPPPFNYDEEMVHVNDGYPVVVDFTGFAQEEGDSPLLPAPVAEKDGDDRRAIVLRYGKEDPRFAWKGFSSKDYCGDESDIGMAFARWATSMSVAPDTWRRMMDRLDRCAPPAQKAMLRRLDAWTADMGQDWIAMDELVTTLERDMSLSHEQVQSGMMLVEVIAGASFLAVSG